jgi:hypothetical protein
MIKEITSERISNIKTSRSIDQNYIFKTSIQRNMKEFLIVVFVSSTIIGLPISYFKVAKKAFSVGYAISAIFATQSTKTSIIFICSSLIFPNILYLISMFIVLVAGGNMIKNTIGTKSDIKHEILKYLTFVITAMLIVICSSLSEAYMSTFFLNLLKKYM